MISFGGPHSTVLIITDREVMRVDVRGDELVALTRETRPAGTPLPIAVELACGLTGKKPAQKTYVLADDFWTGVIDLDERSIHGLGGDDLEQSLRFETESLSDLDPMNSRLGFMELAAVLPDTRRFWGTAVPNEVLSGVAQAVRLRGGKLEWLANPIGMSSPDRLGAAWVEFTAELAAAFAAPTESGGFPRAYVTQRSATSDRWFDALGTQFGDELPPMGWQSRPEDQPAVYTGSLESLSDQTVLERWVQGIATRIANPEGFPHIDAPQIPTSGKTLTKIGIVAAVGMAMLCGGLAWVMNAQIADLRSRTAELERPQKEKKQLEKEIAELRKEIEELRTEADGAAEKRENMRLVVDNGKRFAVLLQSLANGAQSNVVIDAIKPQGKGVTLTGRAIRNDAITLMVERLESSMAKVGWLVLPASVEGANQTVGGGPWTFTIQLVDQPMKSAPSDPSPVSGPDPASESRTAAQSNREPESNASLEGAVTSWRLPSNSPPYPTRE